MKDNNLVCNINTDTLRDVSDSLSEKVDIFQRVVESLKNDDMGSIGNAIKIIKEICTNTENSIN